MRSQVNLCITPAQFCSFMLILEYFCSLFYHNWFRNFYAIWTKFKFGLHPNPILSIIVPCYNRANYINFVFTSLLFDQQIIKNPFKYEIIFINDGSTDNTTQAIQSWTNYYENRYYTPKIRSIQLMKRTGTLNSRFVGYQAAIGKYILSLDPDDEFIPGFLNRILYILNLEKRIEMLHFRILKIRYRKINQTSVYKNKTGYKYPLLTYRVYSPTQYSHLFINEPITTFKYKLEAYYENQQPKLFVFTGSELDWRKSTRTLMWNIWSYCFARELFIKSLSIFNFQLLAKRIYNYEDYYTLYLLFYFCKTVHWIDEIGYIYYRDSPRLSKRKPLNQALFQQINKLYGFDIFPHIVDKKHNLANFTNDNVLTF